MRSNVSTSSPSHSEPPHSLETDPAYPASASTSRARVWLDHVLVR